MPITNTTKITSSVTNSAKVASFETWNTIPTTWVSETRTWDDCVSLMDNISRTISSITNTVKPIP